MAEDTDGTPTRRRTETRRRLIAAAYEVFSAVSLRDAPIELICERAGFSRGAFYSNFSSKEELFLALFQEQTEARLDRFRQVVDQVADGLSVTSQDEVPAALAKAARLFIAPLVADKNWFLLTAEFRVQGLRQPAVRVQIDAAYKRFHRGLGELLAVSLGRIGLRLTVDPADAALVMVAMYEQALENFLMEGTELPADDRFVTELLPKVLASMIELARTPPRTAE